MIGQWSQPARRLLAVAILLALMGALYGVVAVPALAKYHEYRDAAQTSIERIRRFRSVAASRPLLEQRIETLQTRIQESNYFIQEKTPALASAYLQQRVKSLVNKAGGGINETRVLPVAKEDRFTRVGIRVTLSGEVAAAQEILYAIAKNRPLLTVDNFRVEVHRQRVRRRDGESGYKERIRLVYYLNLYGYMRGTA